MEQKDIDKYVKKRAKEHVYDLLDLRPDMVSMGTNEWVQKTEVFIRTIVDDFLTNAGG